MKEKKFNVTRNDEGKVIGIEFNADAFIIPNHAGPLEDFRLDSAKRNAKEVATGLLGKEPDEDELYIQMWYGVEDLDCDNLAAHNAYVTIDGTEYTINIGIASEFLPYSALRGKDDGDIIDIRFENVVLERWDDSKYIIPEDITVTVHATLNQKDYRYRGFGSFAEVLRKVTA